MDHHARLHHTRRARLHYSRGRAMPGCTTRLPGPCRLHRRRPRPAAIDTLPNHARLHSLPARPTTPDRTAPFPTTPASTTRPAIHTLTKPPTAPD